MTLLLTKLGLSMNIYYQNYNPCPHQAKLTQRRQSCLFPHTDFYCFYNSSKKAQMQDESSLNDSSSSSRKNVKAIFQEEEQTSQAFQIGHFYNRKQLNLQELKLRLNTFKRTHRNTQRNRIQTQSPIHRFQECETAKFGELKVRGEKELKKERKDVPELKKPFDRTISHYSQPQSQRKSGYGMKSSSRWVQKQSIIKTPLQAGQEMRPKTTYRPGEQKAINTYRYVNGKRMKTLTEKQDFSKCSQSSLLGSAEEEGLEGKIKVTSQTQVSQLQNHIKFLWGHYQMITKILVTLRGNLTKEKPTLVAYSEVATSRQFQFLKDTLEELSKKGISKQDVSFLKRFSRSMVLSRVFQNLGIVFVALFICFKKSTNSHLTNCIGYASSSVAFIIKFIALVHSFQPPLCYSSTTLAILETIAQYERGTFGGRIAKVSEIGLRLQQNNEVMTIVQGKLSQCMDCQFQETVSGLLKNVDLDSKPFFEYSSYIFQFLAFHMASLKMFGSFPGLELPPAPYFSYFQKKRTLVIEPWGVLFAKKDSSTFVRAHTEFFLSEVGKHWNVVYWSDLMPKDVDDLLERLPAGRCLYRYHCLHIEGQFVKCLDRIGCNVHDTLVVDRALDNFYYNKDSGLVLPWRAQRKDTKLIELLELLKPMFANQEATVATFVGLIRTKLAGTIRKKEGYRLQAKEDKYPSGLAYDER